MWLSKFKLGIPGSEVEFDLNPAAMDFRDGPVAVINENAGGNLTKDVLKNFRPNVTINSTYLTLAQRQLFVSLAGMADFLSFLTRDDWSLIEKDLPDSTTKVTLRNNSIVLLDKALNAVSGASNIVIVGVYTNMAGTGTNYYTGGSYSRSTGQITLGSALADATVDVYVKYSYSGWLVNVRTVNSGIKSGRVDTFSYNFELEGV